MTDEIDTDGVNDMDHTSNDMDTDDVQIPDNKPLVKADGEVKRDPVTGKFLAGTKAGPGRPHGAKSQFNKQVVDSLQALWTEEGDTLLQALARDKPEVIMAMVSRMIPQQLAAEAITGEAEKGQGNQEVTIRLVSQASEPALPEPAIEVEGELLPPDITH